MQPYYQTHPIGVLYLLVVGGWYSMEIIEFFRQRQWRMGVNRVGPRGFLPGLLATLDDRYRAYASNHKRLVPLVW